MQNNMLLLRAIMICCLCKQTWEKVFVMARQRIKKLFNGDRKISILPQFGRSGNPDLPHIGNFNELFDYINNNSDVKENGCLLWHGSYSSGGVGAPQTALRDSDGTKSITRTIRQAWYIAMTGIDTNNTRTHIKPPVCGFADCVQIEHQSFMCE